VLGHQDALLEAEVRELERRQEVADCPHSGSASPAELVHDDEPAIELHAVLLVAEAVGSRTPANCDQQKFSFERLAALEQHPDAGRGVFHALEAGVQLEVDLATAEGPLQQLGAGLVFEGHQVGQRLDDRHFGTERLPDAGELTTDYAAAEDNHRAGNPVEFQGVLARQYSLPVDRQAGQGAGVRPAREDQVSAGVGVTSYRNRARAHEASFAFNHRDVSALDEALESAVQPGDDAVLVGVDAGHVDAVQGGLHPELLALPGEVGHLTGMKQGLGRDAAAV
jgi:hypothetical protein